MKVLIAPDKFKGSLTANEVCEALKIAVLRSHPQASINCIPLADGGDGTLAVLEQNAAFEKIKLASVDPLERPIQSYYLSNGQEAVIELAEASGISRLAKDELNVLKTTTTGTGILLNHALAQGHQKIILALGGSCTTEMGLGILRAIGYEFENKDGHPIRPCGGNLLDIKKIRRKPIPAVELQILCDVDNPLYGPTGAAHVFAKQKGADQHAIAILDNGLKHVADLIKESFDIDIAHLKGGGAAGGIAAGIKGLVPNSYLSPGFDFIAEKCQLEKAIIQSDVVISGEGKLDETSLHGKMILRLAQLCASHDKPFYVVAGDSKLEKEHLTKVGIKKVYRIIDKAKSLEDAIANAKAYLAALEIVIA